MKNHLKRNILINLAVLTVLCLMTAFQAFGADGLIYFSDPAGVTGEDIEVEMTVQADGSSIADVTVMLRYPNENLEFIKGTKASGGAGTIRINGKGTSVNAGKLSYVLTFRASAPGEYTVDIPETGTCEIYDSNGAKINITHYGTSKITVTGDPVNSGKLQLSSLEVSPGKLTPEFSPSVYSYDVTVGLSVNRLTINALPADQTAEISVNDNDNLKEGSNLVTVSVKSGDGLSQTDYQLNVLKTEGGEENLSASTEASSSAETVPGVQLTGKEKTITIMDTGDGVTVPEGYRLSKIVIDKKDAKGWINENDDDPQYFLVYGMNEDGELDFYRYDLREKTIQRYFPEQKKEDAVTPEEYDALNAELTDTKTVLHNSRLLICILAIIGFLFVCLIIYLIIRLRCVSRKLDEALSEAETGRNFRAENPRSGRIRPSVPRIPENSEPYRYGSADEQDYDEDDVYNEEAEDGSSDETLIRSFHDTGSRRTSSAPLTASADGSHEIGDTRVLRQNERRRTSRKADRTDISEETTVLRRTGKRRNPGSDNFEDL